MTYNQCICWQCDINAPEVSSSYFMHSLQNFSRSLKSFYSPSCSLQPRQSYFYRQAFIVSITTSTLSLYFILNGFISLSCVEIGFLASYTPYKSAFRSNIVFRKARGRRQLYFPVLCANETQWKQILGSIIILLCVKNKTEIFYVQLYRMQVKYIVKCFQLLYCQVHLQKLRRKLIYSEFLGMLSVQTSTFLSSKV